MGNKLALLALLSAGLLGAWVFSEWHAQPHLSIDVTAEPQQTLSDSPLPEPAEDFTPVSEFRGTLARPLFVQNRRPEPDEPDPSEAVEQQQIAPAAPPPQLKLSAIIVNDRERSALLLPAGESQSERVKVGESLAGWEVVEIRDDAVVIRAGGREETLGLRDFGPPGAVPSRPATNGGGPRNEAAKRAQTAERIRALREQAAQRRRQARESAR